MTYEYESEEEKAERQQRVKEFTDRAIVTRVLYLEDERRKLNLANAGIPQDAPAHFTYAIRDELEIIRQELLDYGVH